MQSLSWRCTTCHLKAVFSACVSVAKSMRNCVWHMWLRLTGFIIRYIRSDLDRQKILNLSPKLITLSDQVERSQKQSMQKSSLSHVTETTMPCGPDSLSNLCLFDNRFIKLQRLQLWTTVCRAVVESSSLQQQRKAANKWHTPVSLPCRCSKPARQDEA